MDIKKITITKKQFDLLPEKEKVFFVQLGHLQNEITTLTKLLIFSETKSETEVIKKAYTMQKLLIAKLSIGKLHEGWDLLQKNFFGSGLSKKYEPKLPPQGLTYLKNLKKYFGGKKLVSDIRNNFSFHNPSFDEISKQLKAIPGDTEFQVFLGKDYATTNYYMAEEIVLNTMLNYVKKTTLQDAMNEIFKDLAEVSGWFIGFGGYCMVVLLDEFMGPGELKMETLEVEGQGKVKEITIPFFVEN
ncbi:hypothetical protein BMS3Abin07_02467 [bacterium BMS3Abin07]|nr:hypothetical protein BMS3Abin07_02467 [bacterium BMS3Abin07]